MSTSTTPTEVNLAFDIGHSSIGWAVLDLNASTSQPDILGCGVVIFEKNGALANQRRLHRSQRRHVRATRLRIARMEKLLVHLGTLSSEQLQLKHQASGGHSAPWLLAARVLASNGTRLLSWPELWDVLRWYAHNRGYEEIGTEPTEIEDIANDEKKKDAEKVANAKAAMARLGQTTMAETICAWLGLNPLGEQHASRESYKAKNCAFERPVVIAEVRRLLEAHRGQLPTLDDILIATLLDDARAIVVPTIKLPRRYQGSLLFGRLATRYHNRIIGRCPISGEKIPSKNCPEFLRYRWAMQLANMRVATAADQTLRPLSIDERKIVHTVMTAAGHLGVRALKDTVRGLPGISRDNLENLLLHPDAKEAFVLDPAQKLVTSDPQLSAVWPCLPERIQKRTKGRLRRGKQTSLAALRAEAAALGHDLALFDAALLASIASKAKKSKGKKSEPLTLDNVLAAPLDIRRDLARLSGRAPYARPLLTKAFDEVMGGLDPKGKGGCLEETDETRRHRETRPLPQQTNNHLVRHRLLILGRLLRDLIADPSYVSGDLARVTRITIEVNRDLREMSGLSAEDIAKELGARLSSHKKVSEYLEKSLAAERHHEITASLIRKARIAADLGWRCPYTGVEFEPVQLLTDSKSRVDKDHIIPRSQRPTDSLDALVVTFSDINRWKGKRTAWQFIQDEGGKSVPHAPHLSIMPMSRFKEFVAKLDTKGHDDDYKRKRRRKDLLLLERYEEKSGGFTPGQLTQTSQLARLAAQVMREPFMHLAGQPTIVALPGSVTGSIRRSWDLLGCLAAATPAVLDPDGATKTKTEIRDITYLHHALDACVIGLAAALIPNRGDVWRLLSERRLRSDQQAQLVENLPTKLVDFDAQGGFRLRDLPDELKQQLRTRLIERRVVQHIARDMNGLRVEENTRGVLKRENGRIFLRQRKRDATGKRVINETNEPEGKVIGLPLIGQPRGKLAKLNGVRVVADNYGVAILADENLPPEERFVIIPFAHVWKRLNDLKVRNGGKRPQVWRNGQIIRLTKGKRSGLWRIFSIKNNTSGMALDLGIIDAIKPIWINCLLKSLLRDGAAQLNPTLTGADK
jgi:CRISPR-associated endonuclease Csn1